MKIGFITFSCARNYGAVLQTYATYKYLSDLGHDVQLIDYVSLPYQIDRRDFVYLSTQRWSKNFVTRTIWKYTKHRNEIICRDNFRKFVDTYIPHTETCYSNEYLKEHLPDADIFMTGSDQIWNTNYSWTGKPDLPYFLDFVPERIPKFAYSSSFGKSSLENVEKDEIRRLLSRFCAIGVREKTGNAILQDLGIDSTVVADPTLLCSRENWDALASERPEEKDYILLFQIVPDPKLVDVVRKMGKTENKKVVILSPDPSQRRILGNKDVVYLPSVEEWVAYFKFADTVVTDSFHGTIFALNYERNFVAVTTANYNSRITNLLDTVGLSERYTNDIRTEVIIDLAACSINYDLVRKNIEAFIDSSKKWLTKQLNRINEEEK